MEMDLSDFLRWMNSAIDSVRVIFAVYMEKEAAGCFCITGCIEYSPNSLSTGEYPIFRVVCRSYRSWTVLG